MGAAKIAGIVLIAAGVFVLMYHGFSYTRDSHEAKIGPLELSIKNKENVDIPSWAGVGAIVAGAAMLLVGGRKN
jgi:hypothetical protein